VWDGSERSPVPFGKNDDSPASGGLSGTIGIEIRPESFH